MFRFTFCLFCVLVLLSSCQDHDFNYEDISLKCRDTYLIPYGENIIWHSSNPMIASVNGSTITAHRVGDVMISSGKTSFKVSVSTDKVYFKNPSLTWGESKNSILNIIGKKSPIIDTDNILEFRVDSNILYEGYIFEEDKLISSYLIIDCYFIKPTTLSEYLLDFYIPNSSDNFCYSYFYNTVDSNSLVRLDIRTLGDRIVYMIIFTPVRGEQYYDFVINSIKNNHIQKQKQTLPTAQSDLTRIASIFENSFNLLK